MRHAHDDAYWMRRAFSLARRGRGAVHPNPRVGCVLVADGGCVVGEGWHESDGTPHAEAVALAVAGAAAKGSSCYVTLEPCAHHGRTPPCADALMAAGVKRVVAAMEDPDTRVSGAGLAMLRQGGVTTECGLLSVRAEALNPGYIRRKKGGKPWLRCKLAVSLDGRTALQDGQSSWISSTKSRVDVHRLRAESAAIVTGIGTVLADDPRLDIRHVRPLPVPPVRVVLDRTLRIPAKLRMLQSPGRIIVFCCGSKPPPRAAALPGQLEVIALPVQADDFPAAVLGYLGQKLDINEVMLEAGATLGGAFIAANLVDELILYVAGSLLGDAAKPMFKLPAVNGIDIAPRFNFKSIRRINPDIKVVLTPEIISR